MYANHELEDYDTLDVLAERLKVKWLEEAGTPKLLVQTKLSALVELLFSGTQNSKAKEHIRHDLRLLKEFLKILEDHRLKTQGTENWHFTLRLWSRSTQKNLEEFERAWEQQKRYKSPLVSQPGSATAILKGSTVTPAMQLLHNLPARIHTAFMGNQAGLTKLLTLLSPENSASLISIEGVGGVGKTTLALEIAYRCWQATQNPDAYPGIPTFGAIIFVSAKPQHFLGSKLAHRLKVESSLQDLLRVIFRTLDLLDIMPSNFEQQLEVVRECLAKQQTLMIVDNLETLEEHATVLSFLSELPATVKVVLTSRVRLGIGTAISLNCLPLDDGLALIQHYAQEKDVLIDPAQAQHIYQQSGGLPLAIAYGMGQLAVRGLIPDVALALIQSSSDFMHYCFAESVQQIQGQPAHLLLMALALFAQSASLAALQTVALVEPNDAEVGLAALYKLSLVESRQGYYHLHSLTRSYVSTELGMHPNFEQDARNRLVAWYFNFLEPYGRRNWRDWQEFASLEQEWENLCSVMEWCKAQDRYDDFKQIWQQLKGYTQFYGHWHERLAWMDWLTEVATQRQDTAALADALYHTSRTLYLFNQPERTQRAIDLCQQAWQLVQTPNYWELQVDLTIHLAALCSQQQHLDEAMDYLNQGETLLQQWAKGNQTDLYQWIDIDYYRAEIYLQNQDTWQAKQLYAEALRKAEKVGWERAIVYIKGGLAAVAIAEGNLSEAEQLLNFVLLAATQHHDKRCLGFCQSHLALLEKERGNLSMAQQWAQSARDGFEHLKMKHNAIEMNSLLK